MREARVKGIPGWKDYVVLENGCVFSFKGEGTFLSPWLCRGYKQVNLTQNGTRKHFHIHRLVAEAFVPNPNNLPEVNHINRDKLDNRAANLEWVSRSENAMHSREAISESTRRRRMLEPEEVTIIKRLLSEGISRQKIADKFGCSRSSIQHIAMGRTWKHVN